jgi:hypothetical protein
MLSIIYDFLISIRKQGNQLGKNWYVFPVTILILFLTISLHYEKLALSGAEILTPDQMKENLQFIQQTIIKRHPNPYNTTPKAEFEKLYKELMADFTKPMSPKEFYFIANRLVTAVGRDAHTSLNYDSGYYTHKALPIKMVWIEDGMGILESPENPELVHSRVLYFDGVSPEKWLESIGSIRNHENTGILRDLGQGMLQEEWIQQYFFGKDDINGVTIKAEKNGKVVESFVPLVTVERFHEIFPNTATNEKFFNYRMIDDLSAGYFELKECDPEPEYFEALGKFFEQVRKKGYRNIILDLRKNGGGDSSLLVGFLKYMPGDSFNMGTGAGLGGQWEKYSRKPYIWSKSADEKNIKPFNGHVYVLIAQPTFSAGNEFAFTLKDNGLATLVGQKSSNAPCSFGAINCKTLPNGKFTLCVSSKYFKRPSLKCEDDGLVPDVEVPLTLDDVFSGRDPVMDWLKNNLK